MAHPCCCNDEEVAFLVMLEQAADPTPVADAGILYTKDEAGDTELFYEDDSGNVVQITRDGDILGTSVGGFTATRVIFAGAGGNLTDDSGLTFASATNILTVGGGLTVTAGQILSADGTIGAPAWAFGSDPARGFYATGTTGVAYADAGSNVAIIYSSGIRLGSGKGIEWSSNANPDSAGGDVFLFRDAAGMLALRNGANAQRVNIYNTYTDGSNYETGVIRWSSNQFQIFTLGAGTGATTRTLFLFTNGAGNVDLGVSSTSVWRIAGATGHLVAVTDNANDIGATGATRPRSVYVGTTLFAGTNEATVATNPQVVASRAGQATIVVRDTTNDVEANLSAGTTSVNVGSSTNHPVGILLNNATKWTFETTNGSFVPVTDLGPSIGDSSHQINQLFVGSISATSGIFATGGSAANVSFGHNNNPDTGVWFPTTTTIRIGIDAGTIVTFSATAATFDQVVAITVDRSLVLTNQTSSAGANSGTLGNAPAAGDPAYWLKVKINGTNHAIPAWLG